VSQTCVYGGLPATASFVVRCTLLDRGMGKVVVAGVMKALDIPRAKRSAEQNDLLVKSLDVSVCCAVL
jgi:hypothetical protein